MQGRDGKLLEKSHDADVQKSNCPDDQDQADEMRRHHERPPPLAERHGVAEFVRVRLKMADKRSDRSFRNCWIGRIRRFAGANFRVANVASRISGSGDEGDRQEPKRSAPRIHSSARDAQCPEIAKARSRQGCRSAQHEPQGQQRRALMPADQSVRHAGPFEHLSARQSRS